MEGKRVLLPDDFDKILSVMRSRGVSVSIILQNLAQLKALFEKQWESIVGNCDEFLYLGGNEQSTHKYVSELLGKVTIDTNTYGKSTGRSGNYSTNYQISGRELLTPDEVRMLDNRFAFLFLLSTGLRIGEATGLRWCDVDFDNNKIDINHTLVYYDHGNGHCAYEINSTKTEAGTRVIPMTKMAKRALLKEKENQMASGLRCNTSIGGYTDFIFLNRFGKNLNNGAMNKVIRRIVRDYNDIQFLMADDPRSTSETVIVSMFSCHILRHTFATRMIEAGMNVKVVQEILGHTDVTTTLNIYVDATKDLKKKEIENMNKYMEDAM